MPAREQHRKQIDDRAAADLERLGERVDHDGGDRHHGERNDAAAQLAPEPLHSGPRSSCAGNGASDDALQDNTPARGGHPCAGGRGQAGAMRG